MASLAMSVYIPHTHCWTYEQYLQWQIGWQPSSIPGNWIVSMPLCQLNGEENSKVQEKKLTHAVSNAFLQINSSLLLGTISPLDEKNANWGDVFFKITVFWN